MAEFNSTNSTSVYSQADCERFVAESPKTATRTDFERDRARILHSASLRSLGAKTQILGPGQKDFVRSRLTHSLEVAQVGRVLGWRLGCDPDIVDAACLAHDLGHPPYGHNGEKALAEVAQDIGGFEGNAQTFRVVTRLEAKVVGANGQPAGLNLTRATLDALSKYPWAKGQGPASGATRKYGVYAQDLAVFQWMRRGVPPTKRCLEAQIMDLSDDIAYSVHDFEDAVVTGACDLAKLQTEAELDRVIEATIAWYGQTVSADSLAAGACCLFNFAYWFTNYDGGYRARALLKDLTSQLIGRFVEQTVEATRQIYGVGSLNRYLADLVIPPHILAEMQVLKGIAVTYVMKPRESDPAYLRQRTEIKDLVAGLMEKGPEQLQELYKEQWHEAENEADQLRAVIDQVASLTDVSIRKWHGAICGMFSKL